MTNQTIKTVTTVLLSLLFSVVLTQPSYVTANINDVRYKTVEIDGLDIFYTSFKHITQRNQHEI